MCFSIHTRVSIAVAALLVAVGTAAAAQVAALPAGSRIRVRTTNPATTIVGEFVSRSKDSLRIAEGASGGLPASGHGIAFSDMRSLEHSTAAHGHGAEGALIGFRVGLAAGWMIAPGNETECRPSGADPLCFQAVGQAVGEAALGMGAMIGLGLLGTVIGWSVGHGVVSDVWRPVALDQEAARAGRIVPHVSGRRMGLSIAF